MNQTYKSIVWDAFRRTNSRAGHILFMRTFRMGVMRRMNPEEHREFVDTLNDMIVQGLISYEAGDGGMDLIRLTDAGYAELYDSKPDYQIADMVMREFSRINCQVGHIIPMRNFNFNFIPRLNPMEQDRFVGVVNTLINNEFIIYNDGKHDKPIEGLILLERGYNYIYHSTPPDLQSLFS